MPGARGNEACWSDPARWYEEHGNLRTTKGELAAISGEGRWANVDVWIQCPAAWLNDGNALLRFYARTRIGRQILRQIAIRDVPGLTARTGATALVEGIVLQARGYVCDGFEVGVRWLGGEIDQSFKIGAFAWGTECAERPRVHLGAVQLVKTPLPDVTISNVAATQLTTTTRAINRVTVSSLYSNAAGSIVRVGDSGVTPGGAGPGQGQELAPGGSVTIETDDLSSVYAMGSVANLVVSIEIE